MVQCINIAIMRDECNLSHFRVTMELLFKGYLFKKDQMKISVFKLYQVSEDSHVWNLNIQLEFCGLYRSSLI